VLANPRKDKPAASLIGNPSLPPLSFSPTKTKIQTICKSFLMSAPTTNNNNNGIVVDGIVVQQGIPNREEISGLREGSVVSKYLEDLTNKLDILTTRLEALEEINQSNTSQNKGRVTRPEQVAKYLEKLNGYA
jgi:hypothetical protein